MAKPVKHGPEFSREREIKVILEDLRGQFKTFGEGLEGVQGRLGNVEERLDTIEQQVSLIPAISRDVAELRSAFRPFTQQVSEHEHRLSALEKAR